MQGLLAPRIEVLRRALRSASVTTLLLLSVAAAAMAQSSASVTVTPGRAIDGVVQSALTSAPIAFARVSLQPSGRDLIARGNGTFTLSELGEGKHTLVVRQIGFAPSHIDVTVAANAQPDNRDPIVIRLAALPLVLDTVHVVAGDVACRGRGFADPDATPAVRRVLEQLSLNADQYRALRQSYPLETTYATRRWVVTSDGDEYGVIHDTVTEADSTPRDYVPGRVVFQRQRSDGRMAWSANLPGFGSVGQPAFQAHHCFRFAGIERVGTERLVRIDFRPTADLTEADVEGTLYLDPASFLLRHARFRLVQLPRDVTFRDVETRVAFRELLPFYVAPHEIEVTQKLVNMRTSDGKRLTDGRQSDRLLSHRLVGASPDATAAPARGAPPLP